MTYELKPCPWGCIPKHGLSKGSRDMHGDLHQDYKVWCVHASLIGADKERAFNRWNTRPAPKVKELVWDGTPYPGQRANAVGPGFKYQIAFSGDIDEPVYRWAGLRGGWSGVFKSFAEAKAAAQADYERRVLGCIDGVGE